MLHRRAPGSNSGPPTASSSSAPAAPNGNVNTNKAYTPLRRPSQTLYNTPQSSSASKARYKLPSPSPSAGLYVNTASSHGVGAGVGQGGYFPARNSVDLGDGIGYGEADASGSASGTTAEWARHVRYGLERMRMGLRDGLKLDRSLGLVWGYAISSACRLDWAVRG